MLQVACLCMFAPRGDNNRTLLFAGDIAAEHCAVGPPVGVGRQLAGSHSQLSRRRNAADVVAWMWRLQFDPALGTISNLIGSPSMSSKADSRYSP